MTFAKLSKINFQTERTYVLAALCVLLSLFALYIYFVSRSVVQVVIRQEVQQEINQLHSNISQLEAEYIAAQYALSKEITSLDGYEETSDKVFIERTDAALALSGNTR